MKKTSRIALIVLTFTAMFALSGCENYPEGVPSLYSSEYRIVNSWQVTHTFLNGKEIEDTEYTAYKPETFYYIYADHVMRVVGKFNGEIRESSFATYILDPKAKTIDFNYTFCGKRYIYTANVMRLSRRDFIIEFNDEHGDHWRIEMYSRSY